MSPDGAPGSYLVVFFHQRLFFFGCWWSNISVDKTIVYDFGHKSSRKWSVDRQRSIMPRLLTDDDDKCRFSAWSKSYRWAPPYPNLWQLLWRYLGSFVSGVWLLRTTAKFLLVVAFLVSIVPPHWATSHSRAHQIYFLLMTKITPRTDLGPRRPVRKSICL